MSGRGTATGAPPGGKHAHNRRRRPWRGHSRSPARLAAPQRIGPPLDRTIILQYTTTYYYIIMVVGHRRRPEKHKQKARATHIYVYRKILITIIILLVRSYIDYFDATGFLRVIRT